ncbi:MAG: Ig-like domain-containing protein, partial [Thermoflexales bacterium]|nr:Ig-like domain-containing protein [Thermoflexales bacterium]
LIEWHLAQAAQRGRRFAFRVMILSEYEGDVDGDGQTDGLTGVPNYIANNPAMGRRFSSSKPECNNMFVPYWNEPAFLDRVEALMNALSVFDGDPRLAYIDIGIYGHWGEWHMSGLGFSSIPPEINATSATRARLVDIVNQAFQKTRILMLPDVDGDYPDRSGTGFTYAMQNYPRMGVRKDNLSNIWFEQEVSHWFPNVQAAFQNRWRTTPFVTEFFGGENDAALQLAESQVISYHVSMVATNQWHNSTQRIEIGKAAGHRFQLNQATWPDSVQAGYRFEIVSRWSNVGVAPAYENWSPTWELYTSGGTKVWSARSRLDLQRLLPTTINPDTDVNTEETEANGKNAPVTITDDLTLPANLAAGTYTLRLRVPLILANGSEHPYLPPLALATQGRDAQGRYTLGTITVTTPSTPAPVVTLTTHPTQHVVSFGTPILLTATVSSSYAISQVEFLADGLVIGTDATAPYTLTWTPPTPGVYTVIARATDSGNRQAVSAPKFFDVQHRTNIGFSLNLAVSPSAPYTAPATLVLTASAPSTVTLNFVEFYVGSTLVHTDTAAPFTATVGPLAAGVHTLIAKGYDTLGRVGYAHIQVTVNNPPKGPYGGTPRNILSTIQLEDYDEGGSGVSWWDTSPTNEGGAYRNDSVDIQATNDVSGNYHIGWVNAGEWLEYTVVVPHTNTYYWQLRYAAPPNTVNPTVTLTVNGNPAWSNQILPTTGTSAWDFSQWQTWQSPTAVNLTQGTHVLRLTFGGGMANYNWMTFVPAGTPLTLTQRVWIPFVAR